MHRDGPALTDLCRDHADEAHCVAKRFGHASVWDRERNELHPLLLAETGFSLQTEFTDLCRFQKAHDNLDTFSSPTSNLVVKPVVGAWVSRLMI
jgi:hypothetical protein